MIGLQLGAQDVSASAAHTFWPVRSSCVALDYRVHVGHVARAANPLNFP